MNIQNITSLPEYIDNFIKFNKEKLLEIYEREINLKKEGFLYFKCNQEENNVDVFFLETDNILKMMNKETWEQLKTNRGEQKLFFIQDSRNTFIIYL